MHTRSASSFPGPILAALAALAVLLTAALAHAQNILNPKTYASGSGEYELFVDPTEREGVGPATMTMSRNGERLWQREHPFSLWHAHVTDDGRTVGYTYIHGRQGMTIELGRDVPNTVDIVFLDAAGDIAARHAIERQHPAVRANPPAPYEPLINLLVPVPAHDRLIVKLQHSWDDSPEEWIIYKLTTGEHLRTIDNPSVPEFEEEYGFTKIFSIQPIGELPLVARHAYIATFQDGGIETDSAHISVLDLDGNQLWGTTVHNEYSNMEHGWWWRNAHKHTDQLTTTATGFTYHSWSLEERIDFDCEQEGESWTISETGRQNMAFEPHTEPATTLDTITLGLAGTIDLGASPPARFGHIGGFHLDGDGNIGLIPWRQHPRAFILVNPEGEIIHRNDFADLGEDGAPWLSHAIWAGSDEKPGRWLLYSGWPSKAPPTAAWYDIATRTATPINSLGMPRIDAMRPTPDGGFAVLGATDDSLREDVVAFDASGKRRWARQLFSPADITVTTRGEIVAIDVIRHELLWFSSAGTLQRTTDLDQTFGRDASYPSGVHADTDGGVIVRDFGDRPTIYRVTINGEATASFVPAFEDGRTFEIYSGVERAPDGKLWTSDGAAFLQLDDAGIVRHVVGEEPDERPLRTIRALAIGPKGDIYVVNDHNAAIHVFESTGKPQRVLAPGPGVSLGAETITIGQDGSIYGQAPIRGDPVRYDPQGQPRPAMGKVIDTFSEEWRMQPNSNKGWAIGYEHAALFEIDDAGVRAIRPIHRRPDNTWVAKTNDAAIAADGSLALVVSEDRGMFDGLPRLCVYDAQGDAVIQYDMPDQGTWGSIAFVKPYIVTFDNGRDSHIANLYDIRTDAPPRRIEFPQTIDMVDEYRYVHPSPNPGEFLLRASESLELHRIKLPDEPEPHK